MLDHFLESMYKDAQAKSIRNQMAEGLKHLPVDELRKLASGKVKLAYHDDDNWLCKFKGTPFYDNALELETQCLELDAKQQQISLKDNEERRARNSERESLWDAKDSIRLKKRLLELELRKAELEAETGMPQESAEEEFEESPEEEADEAFPEEELAEKDASAYFVNKMRHEAMAKFASQLPQQELPKIASFRFSMAAHRLQKEAGLGQVASTAWQGLKGAGKFIGEAAKGTAGVVKGGGGVQGAMTGLGLSGQAGLQRAGNFIKQNPGAAAMLAGGGAAATGVGGLAAGGVLGRATA